LKLFIEPCSVARRRTVLTLCAQYEVRYVSSLPNGIEVREFGLEAVLCMPMPLARGKPV